MLAGTFVSFGDSQASCGSLYAKLSELDASCNNNNINTFYL